MPISPNEMVNTRLFQSIAPFIKSISNSRLIYELCLASQHTYIHTQTSRLDSGLVWMDTPQGYAFWGDLNYEYRKEKLND